MGTFGIVFLLLFAGFSYALAKYVHSAKVYKKEGGVPVSQMSIYGFTMKTIDGQDKPLADYKGKVVLIVNVASKCGYTPQYKGLEALYEKYKDRGFVILGFPANEFGRQEPGTNDQIKKFCSDKYNVSFDLFSKIVVKGQGIHPLYQYLTTQSGFNGDITWNFNKFLAAKNGEIAARYDSAVTPGSTELVGEVEKLLAKK